jgi:hypothetical protein
VHLHRCPRPHPRRPAPTRRATWSSAPAPATPATPPARTHAPPRPVAHDGESTTTTTQDHARARMRFVALVVAAALGAIAIGTAFGLLLAGD